MHTSSSLALWMPAEIVELVSFFAYPHRATSFTFDSKFLCILTSAQLDD